jgi:hypothetical protein
VKIVIGAAEPLIFAPPRPSRVKRGDGRIPFELFLKYTALCGRKREIKYSHRLRQFNCHYFNL